MKVRGISSIHFDDKDKFFCMYHNQWLPKTAFARHDLNAGRHRCKVCNQARMKRHRQQHPEQSVWRYLVRQVKKRLPDANLSWSKHGTTMTARFPNTDWRTTYLQWTPDVRHHSHSRSRGDGVEPQQTFRWSDVVACSRQR